MSDRPLRHRLPEPELMDRPDEAAAYAAADFAAVHEAFVERLLALAPPAAAAAAAAAALDAVDLGTGPADIPLRIWRRRPNWRITAVDASAAMLDLARRAVDHAGAAGAVAPVLADAKATRLPAHAFDVVFSNSLLHHLTDADRFWAEVKRLAKPGGTLFLRDLARPATDRAAREVVQRYSGAESDLLKQEFHRSLLSAYTPDEVRAQLDAAGLRSLAVEMASDRHLDVWGQPRS